MADQPVLGIGTYAGISCISGQFTLSHGAKPSAATVYFFRNQVIPPTGDFILDGTDEFGNEGKVPFKNCFVDNLQATAGGDPLIVVRILDRRWAWEFAAISGHYNIRTESGDSIYNEKTPRELAALCLEGMGEADADLADFNPEGQPPIEWELVNPARALDELVNQFGYRIVLGIDNRVHIYKAGVGDMSFLEKFTWLEDTMGVDLPKRPDGVIVAAGRTLWNMDLWLEPVGLELSGEWKNIDKLSYRPTAGWALFCPPHPPDNLKYPDSATDEQKELIDQLVVKHIYRSYRISIRKPPHWVGIEDNIPNSPDYGEYISIDGYVGKQVKQRWQLLPLEKSQNLRNNIALKPGEKAGNTLVPKRRDPEITGYFNSGAVVAKDAKTREALRGAQEDYRTYKLPYEVDSERGIVFFEAMTHCIVDKECKPALLKLRIASGVRDEKTRAWKRHTIELRFDSPLGAGMMVVAHEEVQLRYAFDFEKAAMLDNQKDVERELKYYLNATVATLEQRAARTGKFAGILPVNPSGIIQQISWEFGSNGPTTTVSGNTEHNCNVPSYYERRLYAKLQDDKRKLSGPGGPGGTPGGGAPV